MISALKNLESSEESSGTRALILAPTREIAAQGARVGSEIASGMPHVKIATFIGGMSLEVGETSEREKLDEVRKMNRSSLRRTSSSVAAVISPSAHPVG